jgi:PST family polysaccharide transporter
VTINDRAAPPKAPPLGRGAAAGALYIGGAQVVRAISMMASTIVIARILSPSDFGVIAMSAPILAFVLLFQDMGLGTATVQSDTVKPEQSTTLFWLNVAISIPIALLMVIFAPAVGAFYRDSRVGDITAASAGLVIVTSLAIQHTALLNREMRYREMARIVIASSVASAIATIVLAIYLKTYWALFLGSFIGTFIQAAMTWTTHRWRPGLRASWLEARSLVGFGGYVATFNVLNFLNRNVDSILLGRVWGADQLGLYERSQKLMLAPLQLVNSPLSRVMLPLLSRLRDEPDRYRSAYLFALRGLLLATMPAAALAVVASDAVVLVLLGPGWTLAAPIFFWLALAVLYQPLGNSTAWLFLTSGRAKAYAAWALASNVIILLCFVIGLTWGAVGVARSYVIGGAILTPFLLVWATAKTPVRAFDILALLPPFLIAGVGTMLFVKTFESRLAPLPLIVIGLALSYLLAVAVQFALPDGKVFLASLRRLLR